MVELEEQDNVTAAAERGISEIHWLLSEMNMNSKGKVRDTALFENTSSCSILDNGSIRNVVTEH